MSDPRRSIPSVDRLLASAEFAELLDREPRSLVVEAVQQVQAELRTLLAAGRLADPDAAGADWYARRAQDVLDRLRRPSLRPVINATGVILHTNLGRAPLAPVAREAVERATRGYTNLEYDLERGRRGSRYDHCVELMNRLTGAGATLVVNNNAAALVLALNTLAEGRPVVISRGELVEIGGSFRVPEIMARSGARMYEVGSTNRTHLRDYREALSVHPAAILKVHPSNFRVEGFTAHVGVAELAQVARDAGVPLIHDLGSGLLIDSEILGLPPEPTVRDAVAEGADVITLSGDKLLGGPQAGIIVGRAELVDGMRRNPLCRALRVDKMTLAALEATLTLYLDPDRAVREIPVLEMLTRTAESLRLRAERLVGALAGEGVPASVLPGESTVGGGAYPTTTLPTSLVRLEPASVSAAVLDERLRTGQPVVVARVADGHVLLDPRTMDEAEEADVVAAVRAAAA